MAKKQQLSLDEKLEQALVKLEEQPYTVPGNWVWTKLAEIAEFERGITFPSSAKKHQEETGLIPCVRTANIQENLELDDLLYIDRNFMKNNVKKLLNNDDILMSSANSRELVGKVSYVEKIGREMTFGGFVLTIRAKKIVSRFLFYYLRLEFLSGKFRGESTQTTNIANINTKTLGNYLFPVPPLAEQNRIVNVIESLFAKLDRAKELVQASLDSFVERKAAILHQAFSGELTRKWREEKESSDVWKIVGDICAGRKVLAKSQADKERIAKIYECKEIGDNKKLPETWGYISLEKLCHSFQYGTSKKSEKEGEVVVLRMGNLQAGKIDWTDLAYSSDENDMKKYLLTKGDVLFNRTNSPELVGKTSIYEGEFPAIFAGYLIKINNHAELNSRYLNYVLNSSYAKAYCSSVKSDGVNQSNINAQKLAKFEVPFCGIDEQQEIVRILDEVLEQESKAAELADVLQQVDQLKQTILAKAFRGELGTNDPAEERAVELLKSVLQEN